MHEVRRASDGELCGHVSDRGTDDGTAWRSHTVFGAVIGEHPTRADAEANVLDIGLACLAERWCYRASPDDDWVVACIIEARPDAVRIALGYYALPGVPTIDVDRRQIVDDGVLRRDA